MEKNRLFVLLLISLFVLSCGGHDDLFDDEQNIINVVNDSINNPIDSVSGETTNRDTTATTPSTKTLSIARKRAEQFLNIKWENLFDIPSTTSHIGIKAGQHRGIPYSSAKERCKLIGFDVSIKTFMTALHNKHSLL